MKEIINIIRWVFTYIFTIEIFSIEHNIITFVAVTYLNYTVAINDTGVSTRRIMYICADDGGPLLL